MVSQRDFRMRFVDAHVHLSDEEYASCIEEIVFEAKNSNVVALVSNSMDLKTSVGSLQLAEKYSGRVYAALGIHPWSLNTLLDEELQQTSELISEQKHNKRLVAIGEIGLDSKYMKIWDRQLKVFDSMLRLAEDLGLPVIIHSRGTATQIIDMLASYHLKKVLLHWFSGATGKLSKALEIGCYISEGVPTVYSKGIRDVVKRVPLTNLLTETDGPVRFFKPPCNGKRTTPAVIPTVIEAMAQIKATDVGEIAEQVAKNFGNFFGVQLNG